MPNGCNKTSVVSLSLRMHFTNIEIPVTGLPAFAEVSLHKLEREYLVVQRITVAITFTILLLGLGALFYFVDDLQKAKYILIAVAAFVLLSVLSWISTTLSYQYSGYAFREKDVLFRSGWFIRKTRIVSLNRVQHVSVQSGPIERRFHLASVSIFTAGAEQADFTIHGLTNDTAVQIKNWIANQLNGSTTDI